MATLQYSGQRLINAADVSAEGVRLLEAISTEIQSDSAINLESGGFTMGTTGNVKVNLSVAIDAPFDRLATAEQTLAETVVGYGLEPDVTTAKEAIDLQ